MMMLPTGIAYGITLIIFAIMGFTTISNTSADAAQVQAISDALEVNFNINPILLLPPVIVIVAVAMKIPAIPGITLGIFAGVIVGLIFQDASFGDYLDAGINGVSREWVDDVPFINHAGEETLILDRLLNSGGILNMMFSVSMTLIAMMFGGIMETTHQLETIVNRILKVVKTPGALVCLTEITCLASNMTMPEQYISIVIPGRMYASALIPWNTCGVYIRNTLGIPTGSYMMYAFFNILMPITVIILGFTGHGLALEDGKRVGTNKERRAALKAKVDAFNAERVAANNK